jgi:hypothetical protein
MLATQRISIDRRGAGDVALVGAQDQIGAVERIDHVWAAADERLRRLPGRRRVGGRRHHEGARRRHDVKEVGGRVSKLDDERRGVRGPHAHLVLAGLTRQSLGRTDDHAQHVRRGRAGPRVQQAQPGAAHVLGGERGAVAEGEVLADDEFVGATVVADLPAGGERRIRLTGLVEAGQPGVELEEELDVAGIGDEGRVEGSGGSRQVAQRRAGSRDRRPGGPRRGHDEHRRKDCGHAGQQSHAGFGTGAARG